MSSKENVQAAPKEDLHSQIDALLAQAGHGKADKAKGVPPPAVQAAPPVPVKTAEPNDVSGDALAEQIQNLLDDAKSGATKDKAADPAGVEQIDQALAADADKAVEGHFDTSEEAGVKADAPVMNRADETPAAANVATVEEVPDGEPDLEGAFASPEDLLREAAKAPPPVAAQAAATPRAGTGFSADAAAVGRELDEQLQDRPLAATAAPKAVKAPKLRKKIDALGAVRAVLAVINKPLLGSSASTRAAIGWVALGTLFNGSVLLASLVIFPNAGHAAKTGDVAAAEPKKEAAPAGEHGADAKHDKDKPQPKHEKPKKPEKKAKKTAGGE